MTKILIFTGSLFSFMYMYRRKNSLIETEIKVHLPVLFSSIALANELSELGFRVAIVS